MVGDHGHHFARLEVLEPRPTHVRIGTTACVITLREHPAFHGNAESFRFALFERMQVVESLDEQKVGNLFDHRERI